MLVHILSFQNFQSGVTSVVCPESQVYNVIYPTNCCENLCNYETNMKHSFGAAGRRKAHDLYNWSFQSEHWASTKHHPCSGLHSEHAECGYVHVSRTPDGLSSGPSEFLIHIFYSHNPRIPEDAQHFLQAPSCKHLFWVCVCVCVCLQTAGSPHLLVSQLSSPLVEVDVGLPQDNMGVTSANTLRPDRHTDRQTG